MRSPRFWRLGAFILGLCLFLIACVPPEATPAPRTLRLATTTSTADSGLLDTLLPDFEGQCGCTVDVIAVGTGQALALGRRGDADVLLVHHQQVEEAFVAEGYGRARFDVMYNDFVIVGPKDDPAHIASADSAAEAFRRIAATDAPFASRGDQSGTHARELAIWAMAEISPTIQLQHYESLGQGMGATLQFAQERLAYTLSDRGTYLAMSETLPDLTILVGGATIDQNPDPALRNMYGVIPVNGDRFPGIASDLADAFVSWILSPETQERIGQFGRDRFGQPLLYPAASAASAPEPGGDKP